MRWLKNNQTIKAALCGLSVTCIVFGSAYVGSLGIVSSADVEIDKNGNGIHDALEEMLKDGSYPVYESNTNIPNLVNVLILYNRPITEADKSYITKLGGEVGRATPVTDGYILNAGIPKDKIEQLAKGSYDIFIEAQESMKFPRSGFPHRLGR